MQLVLTDPEAEKIYKKMLCLPLLPWQHIDPVFDVLEVDARELSPLFNVFMNYIKRQWLTRGRL